MLSEKEKIKIQYQKEKEERKQKSIENCGKFACEFERTLGSYKITRHICKYWEDCPGCNRWKRKMEKAELEELVLEGKAKKRVEVVEDSPEEKKLKEKYKGKYKRFPKKNGKATFVLDTDDDGLDDELEFEDMDLDDCSEIAEEAGVSPPGRRQSGKLESEEKKEKREGRKAKKKAKEKEMAPADDWWDDSQDVALVAYRQMIIDCVKSGYRLEDIFKMVYAEVLIDESPKTQGEIQFAMLQLEEKTQQICEKLGIPFLFLREKQEYVLLRKVDWKWVKDRVPAPVA